MIEMDTLTLVRWRLAEGRTIADSDVHKLVAQIDQLKAERDRMKQALQEIEDPPPEVFDDGSWEACGWMSERAEAALKGDKEA
jgi:hypothetical protein